MSQKYGIWAVRSAASICGAAQDWCKSDGIPMEFETMDDAAAHAAQMNQECRSPNVHYYPKEMSQELSHDYGFTMRM